MSIPPALWITALPLAGAAAWDLARREVPDAFPLLVLAWAVASRLAGFQEPAWGAALAGLGVGLAVGFALFSLGWWGGGDGKLLAALGTVLGPLGLLVTLPWIALVGAALALAWRRRGHGEVAYAPAIGVGYLLAIAI